MGIITYKFHSSLLNAFVLTHLPWRWQHQVSPSDCCAMVQAIGNLLPLGPGFDPKPVHVDLVLDKVTSRQDFHVLIFSYCCHFAVVLYSYSCLLCGLTSWQSCYIKHLSFFFLSHAPPPHPLLVHTVLQLHFPYICPECRVAKPCSELYIPGHTVSHSEDSGLYSHCHEKLQSVTSACVRDWNYMVTFCQMFVWKLKFCNERCRW